MELKTIPVAEYTSGKANPAFGVYLLPILGQSLRRRLLRQSLRPGLNGLGKAIQFAAGFGDRMVPVPATKDLGIITALILLDKTYV
jgi:hypothetical protein